MDERRMREGKEMEHKGEQPGTRGSTFSIRKLKANGNRYSVRNKKHTRGYYV
jgi:hypothetical protein